MTQNEQTPLQIAGEVVKPGSKQEILLKISEFYTANPVRIPLIVLHGNEPGPRVFITAALHGDEINGVEIVRRFIASINPEQLKGTLLCLPIANIFGFFIRERRLPDRRDLNSAFPGNQKGSVASRIANILFKTIVVDSDYGIDIHSPSTHRFEISHTETDFRNREAHRLNSALGMSVSMNVPAKPGSLQWAAEQIDIPVIVFSAGESGRFHEDVTVAGLKGLFNMLSTLEMYEVERQKPEFTVIVQEGRFIKTHRGGILYVDVKAGDIIHEGDEIGRVMNPFGHCVEYIYAPDTGLVISHSITPLVNPGGEVCMYVMLDKSLEQVEKAQKNSADESV